MKSLTRTMTVLVVLNLAIGGFAFAQGTGAQKGPTYTVSGSVGLPGVTMRGLPGNPITAKDGSYSVTVGDNWTGTVVPVKEGYTFEPQYREYEKLDGDRIDDYTVHVITYTISGRVGLAGVLMMGLPNSPITDNEGVYSVSVPYGWAGTVVPTKRFYTFLPAARSYAKLSANLVNEDYAPTAVAEDYRSEDMYGGSSSSRQRGRRSTGYPPAIGPVGSRKVLVVPAEEVNPKELAEITEDMQVMSYILDERFKETRRIQGVFMDFGDFFGRDNRQTEATYIQGYGVLFAMEVNFTFSPPPKAQAQETEQQGEQGDSTWQRARRQVFSSSQAQGGEGSGSPDEYNSQMVEELKRDLITTLKHAGNIRGLQPDEWVILTVVGGGGPVTGMFGGGMMGGGMMGGMSSSGGSAYGGVSSGGMGGYGAGGFGGTMGGGMGGGMGAGMMVYGQTGASSSTTVLTIRAKKSDVDAFAGGELDFDRFREKVKTVMY